MDWRKQAHLFWEFDCFDIQDGKKCIHKVWWILYQDKVNPEWNWIDDCQLIARRIDSLSDEELSECEDLWHNAVYYESKQIKAISAKEALKKLCEKGDFETIMHLISLGVLPSNFEWNESVININQIDEG